MSDESQTLSPREEPTNRRSAINSTAYRIYKTLQWLIETPLSVETLNARFCEEPLIGKSVSSDSIWLYINTLKALGCRIRRPSLRNQFCYELLSHPFGIALSDNHIETLAQAKAFAQQQFSHSEILILDHLIKKLVKHSNCPSPADTTEQIFHKSRSFDYSASVKYLEILEQSIAKHALLQLIYTSPVRGKELFTFLPECIFYDQGSVYVRGECLGRSEPTNFRLERILGLSEFEQPEILTQLRAQQTRKTSVHILIHPHQMQNFEGFGLTSNQGVYTEEISSRPDGRLDVQLEIRESFYLKQRLLACEFPFQILFPDTLKQDLQHTLTAMCRLYSREDT